MEIYSLCYVNVSSLNLGFLYCILYIVGFFIFVEKLIKMGWDYGVLVKVIIRLSLEYGIFIESKFYGNWFYNLRL